MAFHLIHLRVTYNFHVRRWSIRKPFHFLRRKLLSAQLKPYVSPFQHLIFLDELIVTPQVFIDWSLSKPFFTKRKHCVDWESKSIKYYQSMSTDQHHFWQLQIRKEWKYRNGMFLLCNIRNVCAIGYYAVSAEINLEVVQIRNRVNIFILQTRMGDWPIFKHMILTHATFIIRFLKSTSTMNYFLGTGRLIRLFIEDLKDDPKFKEFDLKLTKQTVWLTGVR